MPNQNVKRNTKHVKQDVVSRLTYHVLPAFTLIELLIVISIIGILASLTLASYGGAQAKARDGIRKSDLAQVKRALELAKSDCTGNSWYPGGTTVTTYALLTTYLQPPNNYMSSVPTDPKNVSPYLYVYTPDGTNTNVGTTPYACPGNTTGSANYTLSATLERTTDQDGQASWTRCAGKPGIPVTYTAGNYYVCNN